jgi:hypothetical protein
VRTRWEASQDGLAVLGYANRARSAERVPVFAPTAGMITYAGRAAQGAAVCLDHAGALSTRYSGLDSLLVPSVDPRGRRRSRVRAGDVLGYLRGSLSLGFRLARSSDGAWHALDPEPAAKQWIAQPWFSEQGPTSALTRTMSGSADLASSIGRDLDVGA